MVTDGYWVGLARSFLYIGEEIKDSVELGEFEFLGLEQKMI